MKVKVFEVDVWADEGASEELVEKIAAAALKANPEGHTHQEDFFEVDGTQYMGRVLYVRENGDREMKIRYNGEQTFMEYTLSHETFDGN